MSLLVPATGVAPARSFDHQLLRLAWLLLHHAGEWCRRRESNPQESCPSQRSERCASAYFATSAWPSIARYPVVGRSGRRSTRPGIKPVSPRSAGNHNFYAALCLAWSHRHPRAGGKPGPAALLPNSAGFQADDDVAPATPCVRRWEREWDLHHTISGLWARRVAATLSRVDEIVALLPPPASGQPSPTPAGIGADRAGGALLRSQHVCQPAVPRVRRPGSQQSACDSSPWPATASTGLMVAATGIAPASRAHEARERAAAPHRVKMRRTRLGTAATAMSTPIVGRVAP